MEQSAEAKKKNSSVLIVGVTGRLGFELANASLEASHPTYCLVRPTSFSDPEKSRKLQILTDSGAIIIEGSLQDEGSLIEAIKQVKVVICAVNSKQVLDQKPLISAIKNARCIERFIPSEFGLDPDKTHISDMDQGFYSRKAEIRRLVEAQGIPYTFISCNFFMSYLLPSLVQPGLKTPPRDKITIFGNGNVKGVFMKETDVAKFTISTMDDPRTLNKVLYLRPQGNMYSMNELAEIWEGKIGKKLEKIYVKEEDLLKKIKETPYPDNMEMVFIYAAFVKGFQTCFQGVENGVLGGGGDNMVNTVNGHRNQSQIDALLPKVLDSVSMLDVEKISLAGKHGVLVTKQGEVFCWGEGQSGRLGHSLSCPKEVESLHSLGSRVKSVSCSEYQTSALTFSGELYTWGDNTSGQGQSSRWLPRRISGVLDGITISKVACGEWHTAIVSTSGQLFTFGDGTFGVLGHGNYQSLTEPKQVDSLAGLRVKSVACGPWHTAAVVALITGPPKSSSPAGKMFTWGDADKGRLGHGDHNPKLKPTCVVSLIDHDFVQVSCGRMLTVGLTSTGAVFTIGSSVHGQLGNPMARENSITLVQGKLKFEFVREIATGSYHVAVLTSKGSVYTWGKGANGQLGLGDTEDRSSPTLVEALRNRQVESITCGSGSTAAVCVHEPITCGLEQSGCRGCSTEFGFMKKRHNCYNCGLLFCSVCTSNKSKNACLAPNENKSFRVCDSCFKGLERSSLNSGQIVKIEDLTPRPLLIKTFSEETDDQYTGTPYKTGLDLNSCSSLMNQTPRWGQVSSPASFRKHCKEESSSSVDSRIPGRVNKNPQSVEKTTKRNGAKEVIKALTSRLHLMSPRAFMRKPTKAHVDTPQTSATSVPCDIEVKDLIDPCESARVPTMHNDACVLGGDLRPSDEPVVTPIVSGQVNKVKQKHEWMEQYQPGVYITFIMLTTGQKGIKRVRFSRKVFKEREAEKWWEDNQQKVYDNYNVDGYINSY